MFKTVKALYCDECNCIICGDCEAELKNLDDGSDYYKVDGKYLCPTCCDTLCEMCAVCDEMHFGYNMVYNENICDGQRICRNCFVNKIFPDVREIFLKLHAETKPDAPTSETEDVGTNEPWRIDPVAARMANY